MRKVTLHVVKPLDSMKTMKRRKKGEQKETMSEELNHKKDVTKEKKIAVVL